jgi:hypothetical protein
MKGIKKTFGEVCTMAGITVTSNGQFASGVALDKPEKQYSEKASLAGSSERKSQSDESVSVCDGVRIVAMSPKSFQHMFCAQD